MTKKGGIIAQAETSGTNPKQDAQGDAKIAGRKGKETLAAIVSSVAGMAISPTNVIKVSRETTHGPFRGTGNGRESR